MAGKTKKKKENSLSKIWRSRYGLATILFALICLATAFYFESTAENVKAEFTPGTGGIIGPFEVPRDKSVYYVEIRQALENLQWSFVTVELLDENKQYLLSFGKELWFEEGRDVDGYWSEGTRDLDMKLTIPNKGTYYLKLSTENSGNPGRIHVKIERKVASSLAFIWIGIFTLIVGIILMRFPTKPSSRFSAN